MQIAQQLAWHNSNCLLFNPYLFKKQALSLFFMQTAKNVKNALARGYEKGIIGALRAAESLEGFELSSFRIV